MISTSIDANTGRVIVTTSDNDVQPYTVCVKDPSDWVEIHDYIINENEIDNIPNRRIDCTSEMQCSTKRSVYEISPLEADVLKNHPKIDWVERSTLFNEVPLKQRVYDQEFDSHLMTNRYKFLCQNRRLSVSGGGNPGTAALDFTQWGILRHSSRTNNFNANTIVSSDSQYTLSGKNVDVVIMDTGVRWDHPEFLLGKITQVQNNLACESETRVRDILIHGASEYGINWSSYGLAAAGSGALGNYKVESALLHEKGYTSYPWSISWHGSHVAGTVAGNQFGHAFESNIWSIACVDRGDCGWSSPSSGFDYIRIWHKNKPINPETGRRNPTVVNGSWGHRQFIASQQPYTATYRGTQVDNTQVSSSVAPAINYMSMLNEGYKQFTATQIAGQEEANEAFNDPDCQDIVWVFAAGNSDDKQDYMQGEDYENEFLTGTFYYAQNTYDSHYNRSGTPAVTKQGQPDAAIVVGAIDSARQTGSQERCSSFSCRGPNIDVWAGGSHILSPYSVGYADPRNPNFDNYAISGTSMASPQVAGVMALYMESQPNATRVEARNWLLTHGSVEVDTSEFYDPYQDSNTSNYWSNTYSLKSSPRRILYNPFCNNGKASMVGVSLEGVSVSNG